MNLLDELKDYLKSTKPLGIIDFEIRLLGSGEYNNNYLLEANNQKYVVRVSTSQLSGDINQLHKEYEVLNYLNGKSISPETYFIDMSGFRYPLLFEEFIEGNEIQKLDIPTLTKIGTIIARINNVPITEPHPFEIREVNYLKDLSDHESLYKSLDENDHSKEWFTRTQELIYLAKEKLGNASNPAKTMLIRRDANPANFIIVEDDIRMVDWEVARVDDPTITLASFINELMLYDVKNLKPSLADMEVVKKVFLKNCPIDNFEELLNSRLLIEELGGLVWGLERMDSLLKGKLRHEDQEERLGWYRKVVEASGNALKTRLKA